MAKKKPSGNYYSRSGMRPMTVAVSPEDHTILTTAAQLEGRSLSQYVARSAVAAAKRLLEKSDKKS